MSESMVERVEKRLREWCEHGCAYPQTCRCRKMAIAAIEAMREPTDAMCEAAEWHQQSDVNAYQDAIDAALTPAKVDGAG